MTDPHPWAWLPGASIFELSYTGAALVALLIQLYTLRSVFRDARVLRRLPGSREVYTMTISSLGNIIGRIVIALLILWVGRMALLTEPLVLPIPSLIQAYAFVLFAVSAQLSILSLREVVYRRVSITAGREAREGIIDTKRDAMIVIDQFSEIKSVNKAASALFGYTHGEMQGKNITEMMPQRYRAAHRRGIQRYLSTGKSSILGRPVMVNILTKDGIEETVEFIITETRGRNGVLFTGIMRPAIQPEAAHDAAMEGSYVGEAHSPIPASEG